MGCCQSVNDNLPPRNAYWTPTADDDIMMIRTPTHAAKLQQPREECWFSHIYAKYIPFMVRERFQMDAMRLHQPEEENFEAAVAFVDISGFTRLSERLIHEYGPEGAEQLNRLISSYFDKLITVIVHFGGDIIKFAGDAMLVVWRSSRIVDKEHHNGANAATAHPLRRRRNSITDRIRPRKQLHEMFEHQEQPLRLLVLRAVMCNLYLINRHNNYLPTGLDESSNIRLQLHTGIGAGRLSSFYVGGVNDMWEFFVAGDPIRQMSAAGEEAKSGDVVLSPEVYAIIADCAVGQQTRDGQFKILGLRERFHMEPYTVPIIEESQEDALNAFVPIVVKKHVESGINILWLPEYRKVFIMFVVLNSIDYNVPNVLEPLQTAVRIVQDVVFAHGGTIARLLADDKGTRFKIAFGMPTLHHDDDALRVTRSAIRIRDMLRIEGQTCAIGIATGWVYCGEAGSGTRCEYTAVGNKVIVAARLTQAAGKMNNIILSDEETYEASKGKIIYNVHEPIQLKGVRALVPIYEPLMLRDDAVTNAKSAKLLGISIDRNETVDLPSMMDDSMALLGSPISVAAAAAAGKVVSGDGGGRQMNGRSPHPKYANGGERQFHGHNLLSPTTIAKSGGGGGGGGGGNFHAGLSSPFHLNISGVSGTATAGGEFFDGGGGNGGGGAIFDGSARGRSKYLKRRMSRAIGAGGVAPMAGRAREQRYLQKMLRNVQQSHETQVLMLEGEGGMGKSVLITDFLLQMERRNIKCLVGSGDSQESNTPYYAYRFVFQELLGIDSMRDPRQRNRVVQKALTGGGLMSMAALLNPILGTTFEEMPFTLKMNADLRGDHTHRLLLTLLQETWEEGDSVLVIVLEDMQYCDSATWALTYDICLSAKQLFLVLTMRRPQRPYPPDYKKMRRLGATKTITLATLSRTDSAQVARAKFGVNELPSVLEEAIYKKTQGHPLYIEEVCHALLNQGLVKVSMDGTLIMDARIERDGLKSVESIQGNVQSVIMGRIDHLPAELRVTLQICAVIGREVAVDVLKAVHHSRIPMGKLRIELHRLQEAGFLTVEDNNNNNNSQTPRNNSGNGASILGNSLLSPRFSELGASIDRTQSLEDDSDDAAETNVFMFKHQFFQEAAYNMLPVARRKELHYAVANYLEATRTNDPGQVAPYSALTHHYKLGGDFAKVYTWATEAGTSAMNANAVREAVNYYQQAFDMLIHQPRLGGDQHTVMMVDTHVRLGNGLYLMGRYNECVPHLREALVFRQQRIPVIDTRDPVAAAASAAATTTTTTTTGGGGGGGSISGSAAQSATQLRSDLLELFKRTLTANDNNNNSNNRRNSAAYQKRVQEQRLKKRSSHSSNAAQEAAVLAAAAATQSTATNDNGNEEEMKSMDHDDDDDDGTCNLCSEV